MDRSSVEADVSVREHVAFSGEIVTIEKRSNPQ